MVIWQRAFTLDALNQSSANTLVEHMAIRYTGFDDYSLTASMPVTSAVMQPFGLLHGGASVTLMETVASCAANLCVSANHYCVGLEVNANHIAACRAGMVNATATALHLGRTTQIWQVEVRDENTKLISVGRLTVAVRDYSASETK